MVLNDSVMEAAAYIRNAKDRAAFIAACCDFVYSGTEPEGLSDMAMSNFVGQRHSLANTRAKMLAGRKQESNPNQTEIKPGSNPNQTRIKRESNRNQKRIKPGSNRGSFNKDKDKEEVITLAGDYEEAPDPPSRPGSVEEVMAYFQANCLKGDPVKFFDFYEAQGWLKSNKMPILDWRAQARNWHREQVKRDAECAARGEPPEGSAAWKPAETPEQELARLDAEAERNGWS